MIKKFLLLLAPLILVVHSLLPASPATNEKRGIQFIENNWEAAIQAARAQHKLIFVDTYASWCIPCQQLKWTSFRNKKTADFFNQHFINLSVNIEEGIGPEMADQFGIHALPTLLFLDAEGKPVLVTMGYLKASQLLQFAQQALRASAR